MQLRRSSIILITLPALAASLLTACTVSASGGIAGLVVTFLFLVGALLAGTTQTGCAATGCGNGTTCLSLPENVNQDDPDAGDTGDTEADADDPLLNACLSPPINMNQPEKDAGDTGESDADSDPDAVGSLDEKRQILEKMNDRLPQDVLQRLEDDLA